MSRPRAIIFDSRDGAGGGTRAGEERTGDEEGTEAVEAVEAGRSRSRRRKKPDEGGASSVRQCVRVLGAFGLWPTFQ